MPICSRCKKRTATDVLHAEATNIRPTHRSICRAPSQIPSNCESGKRQHAQGKQTDESDIKVGGSKQARKEAHVRTGLSKNAANTRDWSNSVTTVISSTQMVSMRRSVTTVPSDLEKETPSYFDRIPQRETSPTRGTTRLAAYDTKPHTHCSTPWGIHLTELMSDSSASRGTDAPAHQTPAKRPSSHNSCRHPARSTHAGNQNRGMSKAE